jgi:hypothetical protein
MSQLGQLRPTRRKQRAHARPLQAESGQVGRHRAKSALCRFCSLIPGFEIVVEFEIDRTHRGRRAGHRKRMTSTRRPRTTMRSVLRDSGSPRTCFATLAGRVPTMPPWRDRPARKSRQSV